MESTRTRVYSLPQLSHLRHRRGETDGQSGDLLVCGHLRVAFLRREAAPCLLHVLGEICQTSQGLVRYLPVFAKDGCRAWYGR